MSQSRADALAPASARESWRFLKTLPSAPTRPKILLVFAFFTVTIVMEQGEIVEDGTHASLIALGGRYAKAYAQWELGH